MDTAGRGRFAVLSTLVAAALLMLTTNVRSDTSQQGATLWVGESKGLYAVSSDSGDVHSQNVLPGGAEGIAVNPANGDVWAYSNRALYRYSGSGVPLDSFSIPLPLLVGTPSGMVIDAKSGNLWLAFRRNLYRFDLQGHLAGSMTLPAPIVGITLDRPNAILWVAQKSRVATFDDSGLPLTDIALDAGGLRIGNEGRCTAQQHVPVTPPAGPLSVQCVYGLSYDPLHGEVWVSLTDRLRRYAVNGDLSADHEVGVHGAIDADGAGGVWLAHRRNLVHIDPDGNQDLELEAFSLLEGLLPITGLAADPLSTTAWVTNERLLKHFDLDGQLLRRLQPSVGGGLVHRILQLALHADAVAPDIRILSPQDGDLLNTAPDVVLEYSDDAGTPDAASIEIKLNNEPAGAACTATDVGAECALSDPLTQGLIELAATVADASGNRSEPATVSFTFDSVAPSIQITHPTEDFITNQAELSLQGSVDETATVKVDDTDIPLDGNLAFSHLTELQEGINTFTVIATDPAANTSVITRSVTLDTIAPGAPVAGQITISEPVDGVVTVTGSAGSAEPGARIRVRNRRTGQIVTVTVTADGSFVAQIAAESGDELEITAVDAAENDSETVTLPVVDGSGLPPDPSVVATPLSETEITPFGDSVAFLYSGANPIQTGVSPGTIEDRRAAVIRGRVLSRDNSPLPGVTVRIKDHPELGQTLSRADGYFDLAVNGGGLLTLDYQRDGYLPSQRQVQTPWRDFAIADDIVLIPVDDRVTEIAAGSTVMQVASGNPVTDADGTRQATMVFEPGTTAEMVLPDGSRQPLSQLSIRATEYTVGDNGPEAMPAELPPTSGYTYAVELSVDQALQAGATSVEFNKPVWLYVDNFLNFPVGSPVPAGWYDRTKAAWIPSDNGKVLKLLSIADGLAELDVMGSGTPADGAAYQALGITDAERARIAIRFTPGQSFWRVGIAHFTPWDCNWPFGPPEDAEEPKQPPAKTDDQVDDPQIECGSIIECHNQVLSEHIPIAGTLFSLAYRSDGVPGRIAAYTLDIPLSGNQIPPSLLRIELHIEVAGRRFQYSFPSASGRRYQFIWDGKDAFGRTHYGSRMTQVSIGYVYQGAYSEPATERGFARFSRTGVIVGDRGRREVTFWQRGRYALGASALGRVTMGRWGFPAHHYYDPLTSTLHRGDGQRSTGTHVGGVISTVAGTGQPGWSGDGLPAIGSRLNSPQRVAAAADGSVYIADALNHRIRRIGQDGVIATVVGTGTGGFNGDGRLGRQTRLNNPHGVAVASDGSVYIADYSNHRVRRMGPGGTVTTVAGTGDSGFSGDNGPAIQARLNGPKDVAVAADGSVYVTDQGNRRVRRIDPEGVITTVAGTGGSGESGDGGLAVEARLWAEGLAVATDGSVYVASDRRVRRIGLDGIITTVAGTGQFAFGGDGGPATEAHLDGVLQDLDIAVDGSYYVSDLRNNRVRRVGPDGVISTVVGIGERGFGGDGGSAAQAKVSSPHGIALTADGTIYVLDTGNHRLRRIAPPMPGFSAGEISVASEDGSELYAFTNAGRHLRTVDARTGTLKYQFGYDAVGRMISIADGDGDVTAIEHDATGRAVAIVAPDGQRTTLVLDERDYLVKVISPANEIWQMSYTDDGLLTGFTNPRDQTSQFAYDDLGRLTRDTNAVGGLYDFSRSEQERGYTVTKTSAGGRTTIYEVEHLTTGDERRTTTAPDGTQTVSLREASATTTDTAADGTVSVRVQGPDPRFGMQSPVTTSLKITTPGGRISSATGTRTAALADADNPLSHTTLTEQFALNGKTWSSVYTTASRQIVATSPANRQITTLIDELSRPLTRQIAGLLPIQSTYDPRGRLTTLTHGENDDARVTSFAYGADGYLASITDAVNRTVSYERDAVGRVTKQTLPGDREIGFSYDPNGNLTSITPPGRDAHVFTYDAVDQLDDYTPPELPEGSTVTQYQYNLDKDLTLVTRPDGNTIAFAYNAPGMKLSAVTTDAGSYGYGYKPTTGQLDTLSASGGLSLSYSYDGFLLTSEALAGEVAGTVSWTYDNNFWATGQSVNGESVSFTYDADGLLTGAGAMSLVPDPQHGLLRATSLGNVTTGQDYNGFGELSEARAQHEDDLLYGAGYGRDKLGRITQKTEIVQGQARLYGYSYDSAGRLQAVTLNGTTISTYVYDANGNRRFLNSTEGQYDEQDRLLSYGNASYTYTKNGELKTKTQSGATTAYDYDALGNLRSVSLPGDISIEYLIDGRNRRVGKKVNGTLTQGLLYQDQLNPVAELDGSGNIKSRFVYADKGNVPSYMIKDGTTYRIVSDHLGSPRLVVNADTGEVVQRMDFDEFGNVTQDTNPGFQPFGFAGGIYDQHTQLTRFGARDYDAETGRWTAKDPIRFAGGDTNLYGYTLNDPVNMIDPAGMTGMFIPTESQYRHLMGYSGASREAIEHAMNMAPVDFEIARTDIQRCAECLVKELAGDAAQSAAVDAGVGLASRYSPPQFGLPLALLYARYRSSDVVRGVEAYDFYQSVRSCTVDR